jgi:hypothetical protein
LSYQSLSSAARRLITLATAFALVACGSDGATRPPTPATLTATSATTSTATVGTAVAAAPSVKVTDDKGGPVSGVAVQFAVTAGGGALGKTSSTTDATGVASASTWNIGTTVGANTATATVAGLAPVQFTVTGTAGPAASIVVSAGDAQSAHVGSAVATAPAITAKDQYGNPVSGAPVTFTILSGGGALTGSATTTGADGTARLGSWTLGIANGAQELRATSGTLTATVGATATVPAGCAVTNYAVGATLQLNWEASDCSSAGVSGVSVSGRSYDRLQFTTATQQQIDASVNGAAGRALLLRNVATGLYVGLQPGAAFSPASQNPMHLKYVLAPGSYAFEPYAPTGTTGAYTLSTTAGTTVNCDYIVFASTNVVIADSIKNTTYNCVGPSGFVEQWVNLQLKTGTKVRITLSNAGFVPLLMLRDDRQGPASPSLVTKRGTTAGETLVIDWTATFDTWHEIIIAPLTAQVGTYTLKIEELP